MWARWIRIDGAKTTREAHLAKIAKQASDSGRPAAEYEEEIKQLLKPQEGSKQVEAAHSFQGTKWRDEDKLVASKIHQAHPEWTVTQKHAEFLQQVEPDRARGLEGFRYQLNILIHKENLRKVKDKGRTGAGKASRSS